MGKHIAQRKGRDTHETQPVRIWVARDVFRQVPVAHPTQN